LDACWRCGHFIDGTPVDADSENITLPPQDDADVETWLNVTRLFGAASGIVLVIIMLKCGLTMPLIAAPFFAIAIFLLRRFESSPTCESAPQEYAEPVGPPSQESSTTRSEISKAIVRRAWQAAVIGACSFPPLGFYSMRLLWKLGRRGTPLSRADNCRFVAAFCLNIATIMFCLGVAGLLLLLPFLP
jgi:hypothetical protein